jgi:hypothetical protein
MPQDYVKLRQSHRQNLESREMYKDVNLYNAYFVSKGTGPQTVQIGAQNQAGAKSQVEARYPGALILGNSSINCRICESRASSE